MQRWNNKREMMGDDPPYLAVGTEVSAKYKGAFCEAKVRKIVRSVKCKVAFKLGLGTMTVTDDQIRGTLRAGSTVEVRHSDKKEYVEATITKIQDCSQYTVVFDDGDITTLRRTALCLKSGRHFAESETLDQLPLTHPEHFGNPVIGGRRGRRNRQDESSDDEEPVRKGKHQKEEKEADIGKVVCVEVSDKKKQKDNWFPGLVVAPTAQDTVRIHVREDYLVRSFKDGRYYTVPKKEATPFTREIGMKVDNNTLRTAVEKALLFLDRDELPPHWDRELLFGMNETSGSDSDAPVDSDSSDDEPREEKDHFVAQLYKFMDDRGTPINKGPTIASKDVDLYKLFKVVHKLGGYNRVTNQNQWKTISHKLGFGQNAATVNLVKHAYKKFLHSFEDFYRKLGCTMVNHPRGHRARNRSNRSLIRDRDRATLAVKDKPTEREPEEVKEESVSEIKKEREETGKDESKVKEIETPKPTREPRKEIQRPRIRDEKVEKKDEKVIQVVSKSVEPIVTKVKDEKIKVDDREERAKQREIVKMDNVAQGKDEIKQEPQQPKNLKDVRVEDSQRVVKVTRRDGKDVKKEEKEEDKVSQASDREVRIKKTVAGSTDCENVEAKEKKPRSLIARLTGNKKTKQASDKISRASKPIGLSSIRQKRTLTERVKAIVKKFKMKAGGVKQVRPKTPPPQDLQEKDEKKKTTQEDTEKVSQINVPQLTRVKSKEETTLTATNLKARKPETVIQEGRIDKKFPSSLPGNPSTSEADKKRGRKRKEAEEKSSSNEEGLDQLPTYKTVSVGDKLKVYYGPTHESKVTYEAKVLSMKGEGNETMYFVHYTGWNTRYDEWIKRGRIADNLSWTPGRAKRIRQAQLQTSRGGPNKRGRRSESSGGGGARSTTPSSVTSSSSRTKSPAVSHQTNRRIRTRTRTRHTSVNTDMSGSESDEEYESESEDESTSAMTRSSSDKRRNHGSGDEEGQSRNKRDSEERESKVDTDVTEEQLRLHSSGDEQDSKEEIGKQSKEIVDRIRSRSYKRRLEEDRLPIEVEGDDREEQMKDEIAEVQNITDIKGKKGEEENCEAFVGRSRSDKRRADENGRLHLTSPEDTKKDLSVDEGQRSERLRTRDKRKGMEIKTLIDSTSDREMKEDIFVDDDKKLRADKRKGDVKTKVEVNLCKELEGSDDNVLEYGSKLKEEDSSKEIVSGKEDVKDEEVHVGERRRSRRMTPKKEESMKINDELDSQPKGRDFDLNQIRSELKGIDKAVKSALDIVQVKPNDAEYDKHVVSESKEKVEDASPALKLSETALAAEDDIYEFKEPEPFEFEVRTKCLDDKSGKIQRRTFGRICEDINIKSHPPVRKKFVRPKRDPLSSNDSKKRFRRTVIKKEEDVFSGVVETDYVENVEVDEHATTSGTSMNMSPPVTSSCLVKPIEHCDKDFDKLCETPGFREVSSNQKSEEILQPLSLFSELPGENDGEIIDDDSEGRLVISETETEAEAEGPLFAHQQRDHEDFFPTLIAESSNLSHDTESQTVVSLENNGAETVHADNKQCEDDEEEGDDDPISAAIQRVIEQSMTDDDSNDALLSSPQATVSTNKKENFKRKKPVLSKEFVDESDTDSSPEGNEAKAMLRIEDIKPRSPVIVSSQSAASSRCDYSLTISENISEEEINEESRNVHDESNIIEEKSEIKVESETVIEEVKILSEERIKIEDGENQGRVSSDNTEESHPNIKETKEESAVVEDQVILDDIKIVIEECDDEIEEETEGRMEEEEMEEETEGIMEEEEMEEEKLDVKEEEDEEEEVQEEEDDEDEENHVCETEETESNLKSLLCEETIPGSPAPVTGLATDSDIGNTQCGAELPFASAPGPSLSNPVVLYKPPPQLPPPPPPPPPLPPPPPPPLPLSHTNEAATVMENTPPTTPESSLSPISNSPRGERSGSSPVLDNESTKSHRDSSEVDMDTYPEVTKIGHYSEEDTVYAGSAVTKKVAANDDVDHHCGKKRRRSHRREDSVKRSKLPHRSPRHNAGSESDDTSENSLDMVSSHSRSPKPSKYNFYVQLDPELDGSQRIAVLQQKLAELRKTYMSVKTELACIDRRRKKLRRREREEKSLKVQEVPCS